MKVLAINYGSSTLKFQVIEMQGEATSPGHDLQLASGTVERIGGRSAMDFATENRDHLRENAEIGDHGEATRRVLGWLGSICLTGPNGLEAVGHGVVHGGHRFVESTLIDDNVLAAIEAFSDLAPLHNGPSLTAIRAARMASGPLVPMVATFDTAFHRTMLERSSKYAIPPELATKHHIRHYGLHGIAHRYMTERYAFVTSTAIERVRLITLQLGNGCSVTAIQRGDSVDTSMGFTFLEGLMMRTRSGDIAPPWRAFWLNAKVWMLTR